MENQLSTFSQKAQLGAKKNILSEVLSPNVLAWDLEAPGTGGGERCEENTGSQLGRGSHFWSGVTTAG